MEKNRFKNSIDPVMSCLEEQHSKEKENSSKAKGQGHR